MTDDRRPIFFKSHRQVLDEETFVEALGWEFDDCPGLALGVWPYPNTFSITHVQSGRTLIGHNFEDMAEAERVLREIAALGLDWTQDETYCVAHYSTDMKRLYERLRAGKAEADQ